MSPAEPVDPRFVATVRRLVRRGHPHAEVWRRLAPVAARIGAPRPSYPTVLRIALRERRALAERTRRREQVAADVLSGRVPRS